MKAIVQNLATEYQDVGAGQVLLLLHGWKDNLRTFDPIVGALSGEYRIIRLDLPGFGGTERPSSPWGLDEYVQFVKDFVHKLNVNIDVIAGHSFGGRIATKGIASHEFNTKRLILIASAGVAKRRTVRNVLLKILAKLGKAILYIPPLVFWRERIRKNLYRRIGSDYADTGALRETFLRVIADDLSDEAKEITVPTLLIWGSEDIETPLNEGERLHRLISNSRLEVMRGAGHFVHRERPKEVVELISTFI